MGRKETNQTNKTKVRKVYCIYGGVTGFNFQKNIVFLSLKMDLVVANNADPDEMLHYAAFHLGLPVTGKGMRHAP